MAKKPTDKPTMTPITADDPEAKSADVVAANLEKLKALFPEAVSEDGVNVDALNQLIGRTVTDADEKYGLNWHGKRKARQLALTPSTGTLRPCPEESVDWVTTQNLFIEGDNLEVLKLLQKSYANKVKLIYIDPPYNTGNDFIYADSFQDSLLNYQTAMGWRTEDGEAVSSLAGSNNPSNSGRYHTNWLNMMYPRLRLAKNLLRNDGVIFISIDENENAALRLLCNEVFGDENFICEFVWKKKSGGGNDTGSIVIDHEYILAFGKTDTPTLFNDPQAEVTTSYNRTDEDGRRYSLDRLDKQSIRYTKSLDYTITGPDGTKYKPQHKDPKHPNATWRWGKQTVKDRYAELVFENGCVYTRNYEKDGAKPRSLLVTDRFGRSRTGKTDLFAVFDRKVMDHPKPVKLMTFLLNISCEDGDIALDYFAGSATLGHALLESEKNVRGIFVQLPEACDDTTESGRNALSMGMKTIADIGRERLRRISKASKKKSKDYRGFRAFKLDTSNIRAWNPDPDDLEGTLQEHTEHLAADRSEIDVLYELLLKLGLDLAVPIETRQVEGKDVHAVGAGTLFACLAESISRNDVEALAQAIIDWHKELAPEGETTIVFRDSGFADDVAKSNLAAILVQAGFDDTRIRSL